MDKPTAAVLPLWYGRFIRLSSAELSFHTQIEAPNQQQQSQSHLNSHQPEAVGHDGNNPLLIIDSVRTNAINRVIAELTHELNQPLTAISILTDTAIKIMARESHGQDAILTSLKTIGIQAKRAGEVIKGLKRLTVEKDLERTMMSMNDIISEVVELVEIEVRLNDIMFVINMSEQDVTVNVDRLLIGQVIVNLIRNSIDAVKGNVNKPKKIELSVIRIDDNVAVIIKDNGSGMTLLEAEKVFQPFYTSKPNGMGLGLAISHSIINAHNSCLCLNSAKGCGSKFYFMLDITKE
ncbi:sensor histidine kinase [Sulfuriflexus mobilis]|uniref:sensor histidine kinase n=1 Tax=Sulfuriflexus mobilis TaxID=1811807 RepID=UPI0015585712|nr:HAMP domain-containing sensor histidine kinase [Sulfuriflexus mobilis]